MFQFDQNYSKKQSLLDLCHDYNLPVSPADDITVLENYLKVISDEYITEENHEEIVPENSKQTARVESAIMEGFRKIFRLKLQN